MRITPIVDTHRHVMWAYTVPTLGAFLICTAMCGSGQRIGTQHTVLEHRPIPEGPASGSDRVIRGGSWRNSGTGPAVGRPLRQLPQSPATSGMGFRVGFQQVNQAPTDLNSTAALSISENQPVGTIVGEFNATDLDNSSSITYHFVSGDNNNSLFTLDI